MGASSYTANLELPQFADGDKPTWRGDLNDAMSKIDVAVHGKVDKTTIDYYVVDYGAVGDGTTGGGTDDTAAINLAITTARNAGGGTVHLMRGKSHYVLGQIFITNEVSLVGDVDNVEAHSGAINTPSIIFGGSSSQIRLGAWPGNNGSTNGEQPGPLMNMVINCNSHGPTGIHTGAVYVEGTGIDVRNVYIENAVGTGLYLQGTQNSEFENVNIYNCHNGIVHDNGCGGLLYTRCEIANNQVGVLNTDDPSVSNGYPFGPAHVTMEHCIIEAYVAVQAFVDIQCGTIDFLNSNIGNNTSTPSSSYQSLVNISNPIYNTISSYATFSNCLFNGGAAGDSAITLVGANNFYMSGQNYIQGHTTAFVQNSAAGIGQIDGFLLQSHVTNLLGITNSGSLVGWITNRVTPIQYVIDTTITNSAITVKEKGDNGIRGAYAANGTLVFYNGTNFVEIGAIGLDPTNTFILYYNPTGGHAFQGAVQFDQAVTCDTTLAVDGALTALSTLAVTGATTVGGNLGVTGGITVGTTLAVTGATTLSGNLGVTLGVTVGTTLSVTGTASFSTISTTGAATVGGNLGVTGGATVGTTLAVTGATTVGGNLGVTGGVTVGTTLAVTGMCTFSAGQVENVTNFAPVSTTVTINAINTRNALIVLSSGTGVTGLTINNPVNGQRLRIMYLTTTATYSAVWPTSAVPGSGKTFPSSLVGASGSTFWSIDFIYLTSVWYEVGRNF